MAKVIVHLEGGLLQWAYILKNKQFPGDKVTGVVVVDFDTQGADADELTVTKDKNDAYLDALIHEEPLCALKPDSDVARVVDAYFEPERVAKAKLKDLPLLLPELQTEAGKEALTQRLKESK